MQILVHNWDEADAALAVYFVSKKGGNIDDITRVGISHHDPLAERKSYVYKTRDEQLIAVTDTENVVTDIRELSDADRGLFKQLSKDAWEPLPLRLRIAVHLIVEHSDPTEELDPEFHPRVDPKPAQPDDPTGLRSIIRPELGGTASSGDEHEPWPDFQVGARE